MIDAQIESFSYAGSEKVALQDIRLSIEQGDTVVFWGDSGSGKSTLLRCLSGLCPYLIFGCFEGSVSYSFQQSTFVLSRSNYQQLFERTGFLFQNPEVQTINSSVVDELVFNLENRGMPREKIQQRLEIVGELFDIERLLAKPLASLSQGQKQLVALLSLVVQGPDVYFFDEPTSMLDMDATRAFIRCIETLKAQGNATILFSTHSEEIAKRLGDQIFVVERGTLAREEQRKVDPPRLMPGAFQKPRRGAPILSAESIHFRYASSAWVLTDINIAFYSGEFTWISGPNGSGKSTLALILAGLLEPQEGEVCFLNTPLKECKGLHPGKIGLVFQNPDHQIFTSSIAEELSIGLANVVDLTREEIDTRVAFALERLRFLDDIDCTDPRELSFGQKKILNMLAMMIARPRVLLLDEPDLALDQRHEGMMIELLSEMLSAGTSIVAISHNRSLIQRYAHRKICLNRELLFDGEPRDAPF